MLVITKTAQSCIQYIVLKLEERVPVRERKRRKRLKRQSLLSGCKFSMQSNNESILKKLNKCFVVG